MLLALCRLLVMGLQGRTTHKGGVLPCWNLSQSMQTPDHAIKHAVSKIPWLVCPDCGAVSQRPLDRLTNPIRLMVLKAAELISVQSDRHGSDRHGSDRSGS